MNIAIDKVPGISPLVTDYFAHEAKAAGFYNGDFRQVDSFVAQASRVRERKIARANVADILREQNGRYGGTDKTFRNIDALAGKGSAIVTGQQTGLFGGPLYTLYKALTTIKLAEKLSNIGGETFVPVFWLASDDHDFREVNHVKILDKANQVAQITYEGHPAESKVPVSRIELNGEIARVITALDEMTHPSEFKDAILDDLRRCYEPGRSFAEAFAYWLMQLLGRFGLVIIDASDAGLKSLARPMFAKEIAEKSPSTNEVQGSSIALEKAGYHRQVTTQDGFLNLFYMEKDRVSIEFKGGDYHIRDSADTLSQAELLARLESYPEYFSPNVLLRPLYQDILLPTVAYIAGPSETAYYAQLLGVYGVFGLDMPVIYPRKNLTLLEGKVERILQAYDMQVHDFWKNIEPMIGELAKQQVPAELQKRLENAQLCINKNIEALENVVTEFEKTLGETVKGAKGRMLGQLEMIEKKITQAAKKKNDVVVNQLHKAQGNLFPDNGLQERVLNVAPFLFRYGYEFIDRLHDAIDIDEFGHQVVRL